MTPEILAERFAAVVQREVQAAHREILQELAEKTHALASAELALSDLNKLLVQTQHDLNALRGVQVAGAPS